MDSVTGLLDGPRARDAFLLRSLLAPPWSMLIQDEAPLTLVAVVRGHAYAVPEGPEGRRGAAVPLGEGDTAILRGPTPYLVADQPGRPPAVLILPGQRCVAPDGSASPMTTFGVRTWGNSPRGDTELLTGTYQLPGATSRRLLNVLPTLVVVRASDWPANQLGAPAPPPRTPPLISLLADEIVRDDPGQEAVLDRLLDLLLIAALRIWFARPDSGAPGWYRAHGDPVIGPALRLLHHEPASPWTVAALARRVGVSRATFARRFADLVGEPPMSFLTGWRLTLAADLLREPGATLASVARQTGYASPYALSTAFKRERGISPASHRGRTDRVAPLAGPDFRR
ncbi:MAG TPA: AraC family transcriptional regulator [Pseudonocardia sp.]|uniref:AraC family transcriptional regulator n=1 Tax=Pseudonocardia sp. TaxID=60912 RepID=UPI002F414A2E